MAIPIWILAAGLTAWYFQQWNREREEKLTKEAQPVRSDTILIGIVFGLLASWVLTLTTGLPTLIGISLASVLPSVLGSFIGLYVMGNYHKAIAKVRHLDLRGIYLNWREREQYALETLVNKRKYRDR